MASDWLEQYKQLLVSGEFNLSRSEFTSDSSYEFYLAQIADKNRALLIFASGIERRDRQQLGVT